ncbi:hypothetical protein LVD17_08925 [Fulvivirga ulvae]|uniref:hypothetical protein n=1 Tax=Fulvivirga ulvae TaxID=2904245 RepID=UPI001F3E7EB2|nr:hypothetical protein [Fulvivirga ulvae]UII33936.1 hypothetical protein LVD17_08925 [Fulvivirga ulvae]
MKKKNPFIKMDESNYVLTILDCNRYELECYVFNNSSEPILFVRDKQLDDYNYAGYFFRVCWDAEDIREDLLPSIDMVMDRNWGDEVFPSELCTAIIEPKVTYFTNNNDLEKGKKDALKDKNLQIDTIDFKKISLKWVEFLEAHCN